MEIWGLYEICIKCGGVAVIYIIYCSNGVYAVFKRLFDGVSGVRVVGKTGKSEVSGKVWVSCWVGILFLYIYLRAYNSSKLPKISIFNFMHIYTTRNSQI